MHFPLQGIALVEISQVSFGDRFAVLQIDLSVRGWIGAFATLAAYAIPISSRTMSFPADSTGGNMLDLPHFLESSFYKSPVNIG